ncbi:hypothetical protein F511_12368 [Dorcoceras hygrometricum]|uniref:Uncharacterized protein n=1 Tax=Dorcoceras hygrometricum TaxID=472368 RepID=A0A2Z7DK11_9LAMI|nr:hypothetical protein F511_12368 [Dorcoceras hygrometricum]
MQNDIVSRFLVISQNDVALFSQLDSKLLDWFALNLRNDDVAPMSSTPVDTSINQQLKSGFKREEKKRALNGLNKQPARTRPAHEEKPAMHLLTKDAKYNSVRRPFNVYHFVFNGQISTKGNKKEHKQLNEAALRRAKSKQCCANQNVNIIRTHNTEPGKTMKNQLAQEHFQCITGEVLWSRLGDLMAFHSLKVLTPNHSTPKRLKTRRQFSDFLEVNKIIGEEEKLAAKEKMKVVEEAETDEKKAKKAAGRKRSMEE